MRGPGARRGEAPSLSWEREEGSEPFNRARGAKKRERSEGAWRIVNDRYSFFAHLQIPIICRSDIADYRHGADYLQIGYFICRYSFYLQIWSIYADNLQVKKKKLK